MNTNIPEPFFLHIQSLPSHLTYHSNCEYRASIRNVFQFQPEKRSYYAGLEQSDIVSDTEIDAESKDEMELDMDSFEKGMEFLFLATHSHPFFLKLYEYAAGRMFSTDLRIGQAVICSYELSDCSVSEPDLPADSAVQSLAKRTAPLSAANPPPPPGLGLILLLFP
jgi:hypothetical protein